MFAIGKICLFVGQSVCMSLSVSLVVVDRDRPNLWGMHPISSSLFQKMTKFAEKLWID